MIIGWFLTGALAWSAPISLLKSGDHCVAYRASKTLFLFMSTKVVGKSCSVSSQVTPGLEGKYAIEVRVPHNSFESGEKKRDEDVSRLLGGSQSSDVTFKTDMKTSPDWNALLMQEKFEIPGTLIINGKEFPVVAEAARASTSEGYEIDGVVKTKLKDLDLHPPQMIAGVLAKVQNEIELHFHLKADRTLGASSILIPPP